MFLVKPEGVYFGDVKLTPEQLEASKENEREKELEEQLHEHFHELQEHLDNDVEEKKKHKRERRGLLKEIYRRKWPNNLVPISFSSAFCKCYTFQLTE